MKIDKEGIWIWRRKKLQPGVPNFLALRIKYDKMSKKMVIKTLAATDASLELYEAHGTIVQWFHHDPELDYDKFLKFNLDARLV
jgi:hypothetical protein